MAKQPIIEIKRRGRSIYGPFTVFRANKNGAPLLTTEVRRFRDINGFMIQSKTRRVIVEFRRRGN